MDNQEYLNQITAKSTPVKPYPGQSKFDLSSILHSKFFLIGVIGLVSFILLLVVGAILSSNKTDTTSDIVSLKLHVDNTSSIINTYQRNLKSSNLRSNNVSLLGLFSSLSSYLSTYLASNPNTKDSDKNEDLIAQAATAKEALNTELFEAKINGNLDHIFAHKMAFEISTIMNEESIIFKNIKDESFQTVLSESYTSLENLYNNYNDFSGTK